MCHVVVVGAPGVQSGEGPTNSVKGRGAQRCGNRTVLVCLCMTSGYLGGNMPDPEGQFYGALSVVLRNGDFIPKLLKMQ